MASIAFSATPIHLHTSSSFPFSTLRSQPNGNGNLIQRHVTVSNFRIRAAKLPAGVEAPKEEPKLQAPFCGFTTTAEIWNSRACMIGLIGTFIVELLIQKGILQVIGVDIGKGLDLPL